MEARDGGSGDPVFGRPSGIRRPRARAREERRPEIGRVPATLTPAFLELHVNVLATSPARLADAGVAFLWPPVRVPVPGT